MSERRVSLGALLILSLGASAATPLWAQSDTLQELMPRAASEVEPPVKAQDALNKEAATSAEASPLGQIAFPEGDETDTLALLSPASTAPSDFDITSCPFGIFRAAYLEAVDNKERLAVMALEEQALTACVQRQTVVNRVLKQEAELRALLSENKTAREEEATADAEAVLKARANDGTTALEPSADGALTDSTQDSDATSDAALLAQMQRAVEDARNSCTQDFSVVMAGHQNQGDSDYSWASLRSAEGQLYVVKPGDLLPGDLRVHSVEASRVMIRDSEGAMRELPRAPDEAQGAIEIGFEYEEVPATQGQSITAWPATTEEGSE